MDEARLSLFAVPGLPEIRPGDDLAALVLDRLAGDGALEDGDILVFAQKVGLSLEEIGAELAKLPADRAPNRRDWDRLSTTWQSRIDERIAELERLRGSLTECIGCGCLSLSRCPLSNPFDQAGRRGPGPRYWMGDPRPASG